MAHPDLDQLLKVALEFAQKMLKEHGEFYPFGASMGIDGKITMDGTATGREHPPSQELLDVRVPPPGSDQKTDAIQVWLEHASGKAVTVFLPYQKGLFGRVRYGNLFTSARNRQFFGTTGGV